MKVEKEVTRKETIKATLVAGLFLLALGGWMLHLRIHPIEKYGENFIPFVLGIVSTFILPVLFWFSSTLTFAYILNGFIVIFGTILMAHFSIAHLKEPITIGSLLLGSTLADIAILWSKFALGKAIFDLEALKSEGDITASGRFFRYPNLGWWGVHLIALSLVYAAGNILWK